MKSIKIKFVDFFPGFDQTNNGIYILLSKYFKLEISNKPDFIIYSCWGHSHLIYDCVKIFFTSENFRPNFYLCDYAIGFDFIDRLNYLRLPLYVYWKEFDYKDLIFPNYNKIILENPKSKFCCFLVSNPRASERINFFKKLSKYKQVDSGGKVFNNTGYLVQDKLKFISPYRFMIAFENSSYPGYVTEKIYECFFTNTIPIYWGSKKNSNDFNPNRILNRLEFDSDEALIERVIELEENPFLYNEFIKQPIFANNNPSIYFNEDRVREFFIKVFNGEKITKASGMREKIGILIRKKRSFETKYIRKRLR